MQTSNSNIHCKHLAYAFPAFALSMLGLAYYTFLPKFMSEIPGSSLYWIGAVLLVTRIIDAIIDPFIGFYSDKISRKKNRVALLNYSTIPLVLISIVLFNPYLYWSESFGHLGFFILSTFFFIFWSFYTVPYEALGVDLENDYKKRNKLFAFRDGAIVLGTLTIAVVLKVLSHNGFTLGVRLTIASILIAILLLVSTVFINLSAGKLSSHASTNDRSVFSGWKILSSNQPFRIIFWTFVIGGIGTAIPATLLLFYAEYVLQDNNSEKYLVAYLLASLVGFYIWSKVGSFLTKKNAWISATLVNTGTFALTLSLTAGDSIPFFIITIISGLGYAGTQMFASSLQADVVDYDRSVHSQDRTAEIYGLWSVAKKLTAALGAGIALPILELSGFKTGEILQSNAKFALIALYAGVPVVTSLISLFLLTKLELPNDKNSNLLNAIASEVS